jgi:hypothetical protein
MAHPLAPLVVCGLVTAVALVWPVAAEACGSEAPDGHGAPVSSVIHEARVAGGGRGRVIFGRCPDGEDLGAGVRQVLRCLAGRPH